MKDEIMTGHPKGRENRRFFAVVSLGNARWYWVVWPSLQELENSQIPMPHIAEGYEKTKAQAVEKALEVAGIYAESIAAKFAKAYHQNTKSGAARKHKGSQNAGARHIPALHEFLYRDTLDIATKRWNSIPHRVVRRTRKYIYVQQQPYSDHDLTGGWLEGEHLTYRLDRQALEQNGYAYIPATARLTDQEEPLFFSYERKKKHGAESPLCLEVLHLTWPCTTAEVQAAFRRLVKSAHPDGGGSHDKFLELQTAYEQAMQLCD